MRVVARHLSHNLRAAVDVALLARASAPGPGIVEGWLTIRGKLRALFLFSILGIGSILGGRMRPEEIENLMHAMNQTRVCQIIREERDDGGEPPAP